METSHSKFDVYEFTVRAAIDPAAHNWIARANRSGLRIARRRGSSGRIQWSISSELGRLLISQVPESECSCTVLAPSIGQLELVRKLRAAGFVVPRRS